VVAEVLEGSAMLASQAMLLYGVPFNKVLRRIREARARRYSMFSTILHSAAETVGEATDNMQPRFQNVLLTGRDAAVGKMLKEASLEELEVSIDAVRRHNSSSHPPDREMILQAGDVLVLLGQPVPLMMAEKRLRDG